jgi:surface protein
MLPHVHAADAVGRSWCCRVLISRSCSVASPSARCMSLCRSRCGTHGAVSFALRRSASLALSLHAHSRSAPPACKARRGPDSRGGLVRRSRHATPLCTDHGARTCRHTDATLRAAVALWFDDKAAAVKQYGPIGDWDTRDVKSMRGLFKNRADFDEDIGRWNTGGVEDMNGMFNGAAKFNRPLDKWDVSTVKAMRSMFYGAASFNQPLDKWDVSSVEDMRYMFANAASFDQPLDRWDVSSVEDMHCMFFAAASLDQPLDTWDVSSVKHKDGIFKGAASFKQPATLKRFGLVLPSPSRVRTDTRRHAVQPHWQPRRSRRAHICSARAHALQCCGARARAMRRSRARTHSSARAKCIHARPTCTGQAEVRAWCAAHSSAGAPPGTCTPAHTRARRSGRRARAPPSCSARTPAVRRYSQDCADRRRPAWRLQA